MTAYDATEAAYKNGYAEASDLHGNTINALLGNIRHLEAELEKVKKERDALLEVAKRGHLCSDCKHCYSGWREVPCVYCRQNKTLCFPGHNLLWEWRGLQDV